MLGNELVIWQRYLELFDLDVQGLYVVGSISGYKEHLSLDRNAIKEAWLGSAFSEVDDYLLSRYFSFHQKEIQFALNELVSHLGNSQLKPELSDLAESMIEELTELLMFLETYFFNFLNAQTVLLDTKQEDDQSKKIIQEKLAIKVSVAQLACFIKLFNDLDCFPASSVVDVIRFFASRFKTKIRTVISAKSLSKEYYSISQKTAATCREILQKMIELIDKQFFP